MAVVVFDVDLFREQFPAFANTTTFPDAMLQMYWDMATCYINDDDTESACFVRALTGDCLVLALNLMTAHLTALSVLIAAGQVPGLMQTATVDKVNVGLTPPPLKTQWQWWISLTPYGQQFFALLQAKSVGGLYIGGLPETLAFRRVGGVFV